MAKASCYCNVHQRNVASLFCQVENIRMSSSDVCDCTKCM